MGVPCILRREGDTVAVPTFTDHRSTGEMPSYTPAASLRATRSRARSLGRAIGLQLDREGVR
jgi:hypothetical protein